MKILHFITSLRTGGAEQLMSDLLPRLRDAGNAVKLLLMDGTHTPIYEQIEQMGIPIHSLGNGESAMHNPLLLLRLRRYLKANAFEVLHAHNTPCQLLLALASDCCPTAKFVTTEHNTTNRRRTWRWYRPVDQWMYHHYSCIICVSTKAEETLRTSLSNNFPADRICTVPNGVDTERFAHALPNSELDERYAGKHLVLMAAAFRKQKDQPTLIRAMRWLPADYQLLLAGEGECLTACKELAKQTGVDDRTTFLGLRSDVPSLLKTAEVVVMSSHYEGLPLFAIEAMASGAPFVATDVDGLHEIASGAAIVFPHEDDRCLAEQIEKLCEDETSAREVAARCRERAGLYGIERMVKGYLQVYESLFKDSL
ncbi:glycosyltransferase [Bacteroides sp. AN502(2024)]|uniref:glycosyltransferase n=1 Tax=Bacteroides sp. AN502(2024) TaxID=3160599 RepID=UPI0035183455